jgi:probable HAF family extracellular repeat protein
MRLSCVCGALLLNLAAGAAVAQVPPVPTYTLTLLPVPTGSAGLTPGAVNASGQVTGAINFFALQASHAFIWYQGTLTDIGTLPYQGSSALGSASGQSINAAGAVAGTVTDPGTPALWSFGFFYSENQVLSPLFNLSGFPFCTATGVNNNDLIVGSCTNQSETVAVLYNDSQATQIGASGQSATAVNDSQQITINGTPGYIYQNADGSTVKIPLLSGGNDETQLDPLAINNAGQAVGWQLQSNGSYLTFLYNSGTTVQVAGVPASATLPGVSINNAGQIVGYTTKSTTSAPQPYVVVAGSADDLNTLISPTDPNQKYVTLLEPYAISDSGAILATGTDSRSAGVTNVYLLTPSSAYGPSVTLKASSNDVTAGTAFTLYWTAQNLKSCTATGSANGNDGWSGAVAADGGQQQVTENKADTYQFTISCVDASGASVSSQASVTVSAKPTPPSGGGGGALDLLLLGALSLGGLRRLARRA